MWRVVVSAAAAEAGPAEFSVAHPAWEMCVIRVRCELDMLTVPTLSRLLSQDLAVGYRALVVDLTDCEFAGSLALAALTQAHQHATSGAKTRFALAGTSRIVARALETSGLGTLFETYPTVSEAVATLGQEQAGEARATGSMIWPGPDS
jgi:anti-anti-sigma factor